MDVFECDFENVGSFYVVYGFEVFNGIGFYLVGYFFKFFVGEFGIGFGEGY